MVGWYAIYRWNWLELRLLVGLLHFQNIVLVRLLGNWLWGGLKLIWGLVFKLSDLLLFG